MKADWFYATVGGLIVCGAAFVLLDVPITAEAPRAAQGPELTVAWEGNHPEAAIEAEARLMDPSALFLPSSLTAATKTSASGGLAVAYSRLAWREPPELAFQATNLQLALPPPMPVPVSPAEALQVHPPGNPALGIGRKDIATAELPARGGWMEVANLSSGQNVISENLPISVAGPNQLSKPFAYYVTVGADGVVGDPFPGPINVAIRGPGTGTLSPSPETSDVAHGGVENSAVLALEKRLDARLSFDHRLGAGFYRISVGP